MLLVQRGLAESREQARRLVMTGQVLVGGHAAPKAGHKIAADSEITVKEMPRFVSRGGEKLQGALDEFGISVRGLNCLDVGSSTGGFTDCMLQNGASAVVALDVGTAQLHWKIRQDSRVTVMEKFNARKLTADDLPFVPQFASFDVSFISLTLVMPPVVEVLADNGMMVTLIKPQFEAGRDQVEKGGVVRSPAVHREVIEKIRRFGTESLGLEWLGECRSPIKGPAGNIEFLGWWKKT